MRAKEIEQHYYAHVLKSYSTFTAEIFPKSGYFVSAVQYLWTSDLSVIVLFEGNSLTTLLSFFTECVRVLASNGSVLKHYWIIFNCRIPWSKVSAQSRK